MVSAVSVTLIEENVSALQQLSNYLNGLTDADYTHVFDRHSGQTIGRHVRHITGHYDCLQQALAGPDAGMVDYEARARRTGVEDSVAAGIAAVANASQALQTAGFSEHGQNHLMQHKIVLTGQDTAALFVPSSLARELVFLSSHTVHHMAIVKLLAEQAGHLLPADFGVHPSTLRDWVANGTPQSKPTQAAARPATPGAAQDAPPDAYGARPIDILALLQEKNAALHQRLPAAGRWLLPKITYQEEINQGLQALSALPCRLFPEYVLEHLGVSTIVTAQSAALPAPESRPVFIANHPTGGLDGVTMMAWLLSVYPTLKVVVTDALLKVPHMAPFVVPVDRYRRARASTEALHAAFAGDEPLLIFPAGRTGRRHQGVIQDADWHKMPVSLGLRHQRTLVPVHIEGHNSRFFDTVAWLRRQLGITLNLEMALLARELMRPACKTFQLTAGTPISPSTLHGMGSNDAERLVQVRACYETLAAATRTPLQSQHEGLAL